MHFCYLRKVGKSKISLNFHTDRKSKVLNKKGRPLKRSKPEEKKLEKYTIIHICRACKRKFIEKLCYDFNAISAYSENKIF
jgi:hypothetical protein